MTAHNRHFSGLLLKRIHLDDAKLTGLAAQLGALPDIKAFIEKEIRKRWLEFDKRFGLNSESGDIWERRGKELIRNVFGFSCNDSQWWREFSWYLAGKYVPGFTISFPKEKKHGRPHEWTFFKLIELYADVEFLKKKTNRPIYEICNRLLKSKEYQKRWSSHSGAALRKAYSKAKTDKNLRFYFRLLRSPALICDTRNNPIDIAIQKHALKI